MYDLTHFLISNSNNNNNNNTILLSLIALSGKGGISVSVKDN
jgi:hypothetical protein